MFQTLQAFLFNICYILHTLLFLVFYSKILFVKSPIFFSGSKIGVKKKQEKKSLTCLDNFPGVFVRTIWGQNRARLL